MRPYPRLGVGLLAIALTAGTAYAGPAAATAPAQPLLTRPLLAQPSPAQPLLTRPSAGQPATGPAAPRDQGAPERIVTLITGDRLRVSADGASVTALPSPGRKDVTFLTQRIDGHLSVTPSDAVALVSAGKVDAKLFDITTLLTYGYDDTLANLPLIVTYAGGDAGERKLRTTAAAADAEISHDLAMTDSLAIEQDKTQAAELWNGLTSAATRTKSRELRGEIRRIALDAKREVLLDTSAAQVGAPVAWAGGLTGKGVSVGLIDTGVDETHPDLAGRVVAKDFTGTGLADTVGHGTHVASTMAGNGASSDGRYRGVAPEATIYSAKACTVEGCKLSDISAAAHWLASTMKVPVVNMSLGGRDTPEVDESEQAVAGLAQSLGTLFVIASGNGGPRSRVSSPASVAEALAVGSVNKQDVFSARFSTPGPRLGDGVLKPEIVAPGEAIMAARSAAMVGAPSTGPYLADTGTSMATPHVAGAAAILRQQHPDWSGPQLKAVLMGSAHPVANANVYQQGAGRLDIGRALTQTVTTTPPAVTLGQHRGPSADDVPITTTVTYRNSGTGALALDLRLDATGPGGAAVPAGMFTLSATGVTVPAGGTAAITITGDTRMQSPVGVYGGSLVASADGTVVNRTPVGLEKQREEYTLTVNNLDRRGEHTYRARVVIAGLDNDYLEAIGELRPEPGLPLGTVRRNLPPGRYLVETNTQTHAGTAQEAFSLLVAPEVSLTRDTTLDMDSRLAKPIKVDLAKPNAVAVGGAVNISADVGMGKTLGFGIVRDSFDKLYSGKVGEGSAERVTSHVFGHWAEKQADGTTRNSPWTVAGAWQEKGRIIQGYERTVRPAELATVRSSFAEELPKSEAVKTIMPEWPGVPEDMYGLSTVLALPGKRTDYFTTADGVKWQAQVSHSAIGAMQWAPHLFGYVSYNAQKGVRYEAGRTYREQWNKGVFGYSLDYQSIFGPGGITRTGDMFDVALSLHTDSQGHMGASVTASTHVVMRRNGVTIEDRAGSGGRIPTTGGPADYELTVETTRAAPAALSTAQKATWTFRSDTGAAETVTNMPVSVVRFLPEFDQHNRAAAGDYDFIPFRVQRQGGATPAKTDRFELTVSYDDGKTWLSPDVQRTGESGVAVIRRPAGTTSGFVSLRSKATMTDGGTVQQEIIRAIRY